MTTARISTLTLALAISFAASACGGDKGDSSDDTTPAKAK